MDGAANHHDVREYFHFIKEKVSSDWKDLGYQLDFSTADINNIAGRNKDDKSCCRDLLYEWQDRNGKRTTIQVLMEALSEAALQSIVDELKEKYPETDVQRRSVETNQAQTGDILEIHSKFGFKVEDLQPRAAGKPIQCSSMPLVLPNDLKYDASTGRVEKRQDTKRTGLEVVPEAFELLEGIKEPVSVLAICGPGRTGKSYILSRLLGTAEAFELGHCMETQTFGIWMGTKVLRGKEFTIVLLDTEGIDAVTGSAGQDASILVLTILLSSYLIYNSLNVPHKGDLDKMQYFTQLAEGVTVKEKEKTQTSALRQVSPDFLWLLRDVSLEMPDKDGKDMTPTEYLKTMVLQRDDDENKESTSNRVGQAILTSFPSVECIILERPSADKAVMNNITQHTDSLNPEFNKGVHALAEWLLLASRAKKSYNKVSSVNGEALSIMTKKYVEAVNKPNCIPVLDNTWEATVEVMRHRAIEEAVTEYKREMQRQYGEATNNGHFPLEESAENELRIKPMAQGLGGHSKSHSTLLDLHNKVLNDVTLKLLETVGHLGTTLEDQSSENKDLVEQMKNRLVERKENSADVTGGELLHYIKQNNELSKTFCQGLKERLLDAIRKLVESPPHDCDFDKLKEELVDARKQYDEQARGPEKWAVRHTMCTDIDNLKDEIEKIKGYQKKVHDAELRAEEKERENQKLHEQMTRELKEQQMICDREIQEMKERAKRAKELYEGESGKLKETIKILEQEKTVMQAELRELKSKNQQLSKQVEDMQQTQQEMERQHAEQIEKMKEETLEEQQNYQKRQEQDVEREKEEKEEETEQLTPGGLIPDEGDDSNEGPGAGNKNRGKKKAKKSGTMKKGRGTRNTNCTIM